MRSHDAWGVRSPARVARDKNHRRLARHECLTPAADAGVGGDAISQRSRRGAIRERQRARSPCNMRRRRLDFVALDTALTGRGKLHGMIDEHESGHAATIRGAIARTRSGSPLWRGCWPHVMMRGHRVRVRVRVPSRMHRAWPPDVWHRAEQREPRADQ